MPVFVISFLAAAARVSLVDIPWVRGKVARQAHVGLPDGTVEEEYGRDGFFGRYAHLYRANAPVGWTRIEGPCRPRAFDLAELPPSSALSRRDVLGNDDVVLSVMRLSEAMDAFARNADGDELFFVHRGAGRLETEYGPLAYRPGDYLLVPRGVMHRLAPTSETFILAMEARSEITFPEKGILGQHALVDPAVLEVPTPGEGSTLAADAAGEWRVDLKRDGEITRVFYPFCPMDVIGWKGTVAPMRLNVDDIRPVSCDRYHLPPTAHATFMMNNAVVCTFLPRLLENGDPAALKVPFYHSNVDYDEVLFYHNGDFFSRRGISPAMLTLHPQGIQHGPQPGAKERAATLSRTDEVAVMLDTKNRLRVLSDAERVERGDYWKSWQTKEAR